MKSHNIVSSDSDYDEVATELPFVNNILQPFQFEPVFKSAETQAKEIHSW